MIQLMRCKNPCRLYIHLAFTYSVGPLSVVWSKLGLAPPFQRKCWARIRRFFDSSERSLPDLNDTLWCALAVIHNLEWDYTFKNNEVSYLLFFLHCNFILIFYLFFDNITLCTKCDIIKYVTPCLYHFFWWNGWCDNIKVRLYYLIHAHSGKSHSH